MLKIIMLIGLIRLLIETQKPFLCAGIYTAVTFLLGLVFGGADILTTLLICVVTFGLAALYFWLLDRFYDTNLFWVIMILGIAIGLV